MKAERDSEREGAQANAGIGRHLPIYHHRLLRHTADIFRLFTAGP